MTLDVGIRGIIEPEVDERKASKEVDSIKEELAEAEQMEVEMEGDMSGLGGGGGPGGGDGGGGGGGGIAGLLGGGLMRVALAGAVGLGILKGIASLADASPALQKQTEMLGRAWKEFWRPFGDRIAEWMAPATEGLLEGARDFGEKADEEGIAAALHDSAGSFFEGLGEGTLDALGVDQFLNDSPLTEVVTGVAATAVITAVGLGALILTASFITTLAAGLATAIAGISAGTLISAVALTALITAAGAVSIVVADMAVESLTGVGLGEWLKDAFSFLPGVESSLSEEDKQAASEQGAGFFKGLQDYIPSLAPEGLNNRMIEYSTGARDTLRPTGNGPNGTTATGLERGGGGAGGGGTEVETDVDDEGIISAITGIPDDIAATLNQNIQMNGRKVAEESGKENESYNSSFDALSG